MDAIWGRCDAYAGTARFGEFIRAHAHEPEALYIAFRDETVGTHPASHLAATSGGALARRAGGQFACRDPPRPVEGQRASSAVGFSAVGRDLDAAIERLIASAPDRARLMASDRPMRLDQRLSWNAADHRQPRPLYRFPVLQLDHQESFAADDIGLLERRPRRPRHGSARPGSRRPPTFREDVVTQNQLTVDHGRAAGTGRSRPRRAVGHRLLREAAVAGRLAHRHQHDSLRQVAPVRRGPAADAGERLRRLLGSLHRRVRRDDPLRSGRDLGDARWISLRTAREICRPSSGFCADHQVPAEVFYSAYPEETVLNIVNDRALARACFGRSGGWLGDLPARGCNE